MLRIYKTDAAETYKTMLYQARTEALDVATDKRQMQLVAPSNVTLAQDDKLIVEFKPDAAANINNTAVFRIPVRHKNAQTGQTYDDELTLGDLNTGYTATNSAYTAAVWGRIGYYIVKAQDTLRLGKALVYNSQIYITLTSA